ARLLRHEPFDRLYVIYTQTDNDIYGSIQLGIANTLDYLRSFNERILLTGFEFRERLFPFFGYFSHFFPTCRVKHPSLNYSQGAFPVTEMPILRAVPATIFIPAST